MLVANAVVDPDQPRLQVGENQMDDRQVLLGNSEVLIAALTEASIAAPIVSNDQRSRRDGALDEPTERLGATVEHDGEPNASGIASVFPVVELWTHPEKVEAPYTVCIASASNLTGLVKSSVECRRTGL